MDQLQPTAYEPSRERRPSQSSLSSARIHSTTDFQNAVTAANLNDPSFNYDQIWKFAFYIKIAQWAIAVVCAGFYSKGINLMTNSITTRALPYVVFFGYMLINSVIIISYIMKDKMPEMLIRMFGFLGGVLFTVTGALSLQVWYVYQDPLENSRVCLLMEGLFSLLGAVLYYVDTASSYYKSLNGIFI